jgi:hypothetical protein
MNMGPPLSEVQIQLSKKLYNLFVKSSFSQRGFEIGFLDNSVNFLNAMNKDLELVADVNFLDPQTFQSPLYMLADAYSRYRRKGIIDPRAIDFFQKAILAFVNKGADIGFSLPKNPAVTVIRILEAIDPHFAQQALAALYARPMVAKEQPGPFASVNFPAPAAFIPSGMPVAKAPSAPLMPVPVVAFVQPPMPQQSLDVFRRALQVALDNVNKEPNNLPLMQINVMEVNLRFSQLCNERIAASPAAAAPPPYAYAISKP